MTLVRYRLDAPLVALRGCCGTLLPDGRADIAGAVRDVPLRHLERAEFFIWVDGESCDLSFPSLESAVDMLLGLGVALDGGWRGAKDGTIYEIRLDG